MDDVQRALESAWNRILPRLRSSPTELARRLARRQRSALIGQPPRAWCLVVRATDTRLDPLCSTHPADALRHTLKHPREPAHVKVLLDSDSLRTLCAPVHLTAPGEPLIDVARKLGTTPAGLLGARVAGVFQTHHVAGLGGHWGKPRPLLYTRQPLDPAARGFASPDPVWAATARHLPGRIPRGIKAMLTRVPLLVPRTGSYFADDPDDDDAHRAGGPDGRAAKSHKHPELDGNPPPHRERDGRILPPPRPDPGWHKWDGETFLGHDRTSPLAAANHADRQRRLVLTRAAAKRRRRENFYPGPDGAGSLVFRGWRWQCPRCRRLVNLLFYPLPRMHLLPMPLEIPALPGNSDDPAPAPALKPAPKPGFACARCHRVRHIGRCHPDSWNELVTYLSAGLLFGREVPRPDWFDRERKLDYHPRPTRAPSVRRPQIERGLLAGKTIRQIAADIGLSFGTVLWYAQQIYPQHGVTCLKELLLKYGMTPRPRMRGKALGKRGAGRVCRHRAKRSRARCGPKDHSDLAPVRSTGGSPTVSHVARRQTETRGAAHLRSLSLDAIERYTRDSCPR
jgi:hypothetical protein